MKIIELFKNKKFTNVFILILSFILCIVCGLSIMLSSFLEYNAYYTLAKKAKEEQKYINSLPFEFVGITAELSDDVVYANNGGAKPTEDDFVVRANFTEKGKESSKILSPTEYTISVPDTFVTSGGTVVIEYIYQPEKAEGATEEPAPIKSTAKLNLSLSNAEIVKFDVIEQPYRVYYAEGMAFNPEGMVVQATYNDGSKLTLDADDVVASAEPLVAGAESAVVDIQGIAANVAVTVVSEADYEDGKITAINVEGEVYIEEGKSVDTNPVPVTVRATYANGNRLILDEDEYTVASIAGNEGVPAVAETGYIVTATLNGFADISDSYVTYVKKSFEAESATLDNSLASEVVKNYAYKNDTFVAGDNVTAVKAVNGKKITFNVTASQTAKSDFILAMASTTVKNGGFAPIALNDIMGVTVNGLPVGISASSVIAGIETVATADQNKAVFGDYRLGGLPLTAGDNEIVITFKNITSSTRVYLDKIGMVTGGKGPISGTIGAYLGYIAEKGVAPKLELSQALDWSQPFATHSTGTQLYGLCSDGEYMYCSVLYNQGENNRQRAIAKYDPETGNIIGVWNSGGRTKSRSETAGISYYDGKIIYFTSDGKRWALDAETLSSTSTPEEYTGYDFAGWTADNGAAFADVYYNEELKKYAVTKTDTNGAALDFRIYESDKASYTPVKLQASSVSGATPKRMTGSNGYIYINYGKNAQYQPIVQVYDWSGNYVGELTLPNSIEDMGGDTEILKPANMNAQGIVFHKNALYFAVNRFNQPTSAKLDSYTIMKVDMMAGALTAPTPEPVPYTLGEYVAAVENYNANLGDGDTAKTLDVTATMPENGLLPVSAGEVKDIVFDGKNYYVSATQEGGRIVSVYQINSVSMFITAISKKLAYDDALYGNNSQLCIVDGTLMVLSESGKSYGIKLADFTNGCELTLVSDEAGLIGTIDDVSYSEDIKRAVVLSRNTFAIVDATNANAIPVTVDLTAELAEVKTYYVNNDVMTNVTVGSVTTDEKYVYVAYKAEGATDIVLSIYDYNGNKVNTTYLTAKITVPVEEKTFETAAIFVQNDKITAVIKDTAAGRGYLYEIQSPATI